MVIDKTKKFIVGYESIPTLIEKINKSTDYPRVVMKNVTMTRAIFRTPNFSNSNSSHEWLRIRVGDIDCEGNTRCSITYKKKSDADNFPTEAKLEVDDYYEATHMFNLLGFHKSSIQETKRTKYVCTYEEIKYIVCLDIWPGLEDIVFVSIDPGPNAEDIDVRGFVDLLHIEKLKLQSKHVDVDTEYKTRYGKTASEIKNLKFDFFDLQPIEV